MLIEPRWVLSLTPSRTKFMLTLYHSKFRIPSRSPVPRYPLSKLRIVSLTILTSLSTMLRLPALAADVFLMKRYLGSESCLRLLGRSAEWLRWWRSWTRGIRRIWVNINGWEGESRLWMQYVLPLSSCVYLFFVFHPWNWYFGWPFSYRSRNHQLVKFYAELCGIDMRRTRRRWKENFNHGTVDSQSRMRFLFTLEMVADDDHDNDIYS